VPRLRRPLALLAALLAGGGLAACGKHPDESARVVRAETEGLYLDVGELKYQVQVSRQLNPSDAQDRPYLLGVAPAERELEADEVWFAVFLRVQNETSEAMMPAGDIEVVDTQEDVFRPLRLADSNVFAYRADEPIPAGELIPARDTAAFDTPIQGALLLFKLTLDALDNRPLELKIEGREAPQQTGIIDLDV
jgi:hypothetical protein